MTRDDDRCRYGKNEPTRDVALPEAIERVVRFDSWLRVANREAQEVCLRCGGPIGRLTVCPFCAVGQPKPEPHT